MKQSEAGFESKPPPYSCKHVYEDGDGVKMPKFTAGLNPFIDQYKNISGLYG